MWERARNSRAVCSVLIGLATTAALVPPCRAVQGQAGREETLRLRETVAALQEQVAALKARAAVMEAEIAALRARLGDGDRPPGELTEAALLLRLHRRLSQPGALPGLTPTADIALPADANPYFGNGAETIEELGEDFGRGLVEFGLAFDQEQAGAALVDATEFVLVAGLENQETREEFIVIGWAFRDDEAAAAAMELLPEQWANEETQLATRRWGNAVILCAAEPENAPPARFDELSKAVWAMVDVGAKPAAGLEFAPEDLGPEAAAGVELLRALYEEHVAGDAFEGLGLMAADQIALLTENPYLGAGEEFVGPAAEGFALVLRADGLEREADAVADALAEHLVAALVVGYESEGGDGALLLSGYALDSVDTAVRLAGALPSPYTDEEGDMRWVVLQGQSVVLMCMASLDLPDDEFDRLVGIVNWSMAGKAGE